jgi:hypothetical protein
MSAYVCIMTNPAFADWSHVSVCHDPPEKHALKVQREYEVSEEFVIEGYTRTDAPERIEQAMRQRFAKQHRAHEFYEVEPLEALAVLAGVPDTTERMTVRDVWAKTLGLVR